MARGRITIINYSSGLRFNITSVSIQAQSRITPLMRRAFGQKEKKGLHINMYTRIDNALKNPVVPVKIYTHIEIYQAAWKIRV